VWLGETLIPAPARLYRVERRKPNLKLFKTKHLNKTITYRSKHYYTGAKKVRMETYDAAGTTLVKAYDYLSGMVYLTTPLSSGEGPGVRSELDFIASSEGRAILTKKVLNLTEDPITGDKFRFEYSLKDHLGNLRVSCRCGEPKRDAQGVIIPEGQPGAGTEQLSVVQEQHYDAWGLAFSTSNQSPITNNQTAGRFTYNGKELVTDLDLGWNDYGARMYMSEIGRWNGVDLMSEDFYPLSSYVFAFNTVLNFKDPDGMRPIPLFSKFKNWSYRVDSWFGKRDTGLKGASKFHKGLDFNYTGGGATDFGAPILTTHDGIVSVDDNKEGGEGRSVVVTSPDRKFRTRYFHLSSISVKDGEKITESTIIGEMGGSANGKERGREVHLHYEIQVYDEETKKFIPYDPTQGKEKKLSNIVDPQNWIKPRSKKDNSRSEKSSSFFYIPVDSNTFSQLSIFDQLRLLLPGRYKVVDGKVVPE
jgi:RHS repeat-associated protein